MMLRRFAAAAPLLLALFLGAARAQAPGVFTVQLSNECSSKTLLAALVTQSLEGKWEPQGFWKLAPGAVETAAETPNRTYYVYAHELGDPECANGCWSGSTMTTLQGEEWPFLEKTIKPDVTPGAIVKQRFTC